MTETKNEKSASDIDLDVFEVSACKDKHLQPFFNVFHYRGDNYAEQQLGDLFGVIQILDQSKNSAYLPNVISQVIKKEFFSDTKRTTEKAFEASLHKANLALTDLAEHEIVEWIGQLNAVIGAICRNDFHFTQAGGGRILLIRNKLITDVSRGLDDGEGVEHPIKTFSNISSGTIQPEDKLMFCTETVFDAVKWEEFKRHCQTFNSDELDNIFRSTLMAEGDQAGSVVVNARERGVVAAAAPVVEEFLGDEQPPEKNYFGGEMAVPKPIPLVLASPESSPPKAEVNQNENLPETRPSHAHLTVPPGRQLPRPVAAPTGSLELPGESLVEKDQPRVSPSQREQYNQQFDEQAYLPGQQSGAEAPLEQQHELFIKEENLPVDAPEEPRYFKKKLQELSMELKLWFKDYWPKVRRKLSLAARRGLARIKTNLKVALAGLSTVPARLKTILVAAIIKISQYKKNRKKAANIGAYGAEDDETSFTNKEKTNNSPPSRNFLVQPYTSYQSKTSESQSTGIRTSALQSILTLMGSARMRKRLTVLATMFIGVGLLSMLIYSAANMGNHSDDTKVQGAATQESPSALQEEPMPQANTSLENIVNINQEIAQIVGMRGELFLLGKQDTLLRYNTKENVLTDVPLPQDLKGISAMAAMPDLKLVFFITPSKVYSYSPVTDNFEANTISLPENADIAQADTFMTYLYLLDKNSNMIYRYSRASGGFGDRKAWLKSELQLGQTADMAIDGSIFLAMADGSVKKLFDNKEAPDFQPSITSASPARLATAGENHPLYVLDSKKSKITVMSKAGTPGKEYINVQLQAAKDLWAADKELFVLSQDNQLLKIAL